jgi:hypothetical protein
MFMAKKYETGFSILKKLRFSGFGENRVGNSKRDPLDFAYSIEQRQAEYIQAL